MQSQHVVVIFESVAFYEMDRMHHVTSLSISFSFVKCAIWPITFRCMFQKWWKDAYAMMWNNLSCNINDKLLLKVQMKSEFLTSRSNSLKMRSSCTWIFKNERVSKWSLFYLNIVAVLTYQVKMTWNQKSPTNLKISECLHHVPEGGRPRCVCFSWRSF